MADQLDPMSDQLDGLASDPLDASVCGACNECCEPVCCCPCCPCQVWVNAIFLFRDMGESGEWYYPPKGERRWIWDDDDSDLAMGTSVGLTFCPDPCNTSCRVGMEFYAIPNWTATESVAGNIGVAFPSLVYLPELQQQGDPDSGYGVATFHYQSNLYNTEFNIYRQSPNICWLTMLAGFRWMEISEAYSAVFETGGTSPNFGIDVNNHLYGFQLGGLVNLRNNGRWRVDSWLKLGLFANSADQDTFEDFTSTGGQVLTVGARSADFAFVGDMGISLSRQLTQNLYLRFSYMGLWVEGVALAPQQLDNMDPSVAFATLDNSDNVFYHGGFLGAEFLW